jgi:hypothetical protein
MFRYPLDKPDTILQTQLRNKRLETFQLGAPADHVEFDRIFRTSEATDHQVCTLVFHKATILKESEVSTGVADSGLLVKIVKHSTVYRIHKLIVTAPGHPKRLIGARAAGDQQRIGRLLAGKEQAMHELHHRMQPAPHSIRRSLAAAKSGRIVNIAIYGTNYEGGSPD